MRFRLDFVTENNVIPVDYRRIILSYIKNSLKKYDEKVYNDYYHADDPIHKDFTFSLNFGICRFIEDEIVMEDNNISLYYSTSDYLLGTHLFASFREQVNKIFKIKNNALMLKKIVFFKSKDIISDIIEFKIVSPLLIRDHKENNKDYYYSFEDKGYKGILINNLKYRLSDTPEKLLNEIEFFPQKIKTVLVKNYGVILKGNIGFLKIKAHPKILEYIYNSGLGAKNSMGFGMLEISKRG